MRDLIICPKPHTKKKRKKEEHTYVNYHVM